MFETIEIIWSVMDPFPAGDAGASVIALFTTAILLFTVLVTYHEMLHAARAWRVLWLVRRLTRDDDDDVFHRQEDVDDVANQISKACPELSSGARKLAESTYEADRSVFTVQAAGDFFPADLIRSTGRGAFVPSAILMAAPGLLTAIGIFGTFVGLVKGLSDYKLALAQADFESGI
ncbi:MAG: hypothetical protein QF464_19265, partial [Myxococcota bacterium]|nr:hypothetical protein [Myxococcota bacterium]